MDESIFRIALASIAGLTPDTARQWTSRLGSEEAFFAASEESLVSIAGKRRVFFDRGYRQQLLDKARTEAEFIQRYNIHTYYYSDDNYPVRLAQCDDAPLMLYALGECDLDAAHVISIVGTRHSTPYGADFVRRLVAGLAESLDNVIIVSGLAYGTDVSAHRASLECGLRTVGVLGHGLNRIYPADHRDVADRMVRSGGMLLTEYTTSSHGAKGNFLARNRIIAGLADCTVVAESDTKGGSLVTASAAMQYSRDVMALPGRISDRYSRGCNNLIATNSAALITGADDLMALMGWKGREPEGTQQSLAIELTDDEQTVCRALEGKEDMTLNDLSATTGQPVHTLMSLLVDMEFKGLLTALPGARYRLDL